MKTKLNLMRSRIGGSKGKLDRSNLKRIYELHIEECELELPKESISFDDVDELLEKAKDGVEDADNDVVDEEMETTELIDSDSNDEFEDLLRDLRFDHGVWRMKYDVSELHLEDNENVENFQDFVDKDVKKFKDFVDEDVERFEDFVDENIEKLESFADEDIEKFEDFVDENVEKLESFIDDVEKLESFDKKIEHSDDSKIFTEEDEQVHTLLQSCQSHQSLPPQLRCTLQAQIIVANLRTAVCHLL